MTALVLLLTLLVCLVGVGLLLLVALPIASNYAERARMEREVQAAAWRIHQQAVVAFGQMLHAARQVEPGTKEGDRDGA